MPKCYKLEFYVPESHLDDVKEAVFKAGGGRIGNYDCCCWQVKGDGQFRGLEGSDPFIGEKGEIEKVEEYKVELICATSSIMHVLAALRSTHPYETPAYQYWEVNI